MCLCIVRGRGESVGVGVCGVRSRGEKGRIGGVKVV